MYKKIILAVLCILCFGLIIKTCFFSKTCEELAIDHFNCVKTQLIEQNILKKHNTKALGLIIDSCKDEIL
jgi:hypothetical protein